MEALEHLIGPVVVDRAVHGALKEGEASRSPGTKYRHYAPKAPVTVFTGAPEASACAIAQRMGPSSGVICFDEYTHLFPRQVVRSLGPYADKQVQAQRIFRLLRSFDDSAVTEILAQCPDDRGLGLAISNRLKQAAGFHVVDQEAERIILGITGGTGAGKTSALNVLREMGGTVIDCDRLYWKLVDENEDMRNAINVAFPGVFSMDGVLNRRMLAEQVFSEKNKRDRLNDIVYRHLLPDLERQILSVEKGLCAVEGITLLECGLDRLCDKTVAVTAPIELRVRRVMARDGISESFARLRISAQKPDEFYRSRCDCELSNAAETPESFREEARNFFRRMLKELEEEKRYGAPDLSLESKAYSTADQQAEKGNQTEELS